MAKKTRNAIEILERLTGDAPELREMIAEEAVKAHEEASEFWDTHSLADFPTQIVEIEYAPEGQEELAQALAEADRGEGIDGWPFLAELRRS